MVQVVVQCQTSVPKFYLHQMIHPLEEQQVDLVVEIPEEGLIRLFGGERLVEGLSALDCDFGAPRCDLTS